MSETYTYKRALRLLENPFLQVLVTKFSLIHRDQGTDLEVKFSEDTDAITSGKDKDQVKESIAHFDARSDHLQGILDEVLIDRTRNSYFHSEDDQDFPFRYASGGTLPIVRMRDKNGKNGKDYYCFFYRDIFPIGWNIANGGCCTRDELLNPVQAIERELQEELIILDRHKKVQYVFKLGKTQTFRPHSLGAHKGWLDILPDLAHGTFKKMQVVSKWIDGPDIARVQIDNDDFAEITGCFVNVNAKDFGIELDKVVKIAPRSNVVLCDGEQTRNFVLNRLVGLFEVDSLNEQLLDNTKPQSNTFLPDFFFYGGEDSRNHPEFLLDAKVEEMASHLAKMLVRSTKEWEYFVDCRKDGSHFDLCPVARRIVKRYAAGRRSSHHNRRAKLFISYGGDDEKIAREVSKFLQPIDTFFFWDYPFRDVLSATIDEALEDAECLILIGSSLSNINREHCKYEWRRFWQDLRDGVKEDCPILLYLDHRIDVRDLPAELLDWPRVRFWSPSSPESLGKLRGVLPRDLSENPE
jgi:hypothetical protein